MRIRLFTFLIFTLTACGAEPAAQSTLSPTVAALSSMPTQPAATTQASTSAAPMSAQPSAYPDLGPAPEISGDTWLNTETPLRLPDLRGKVTLIDMWTFGCINCRNVIPSLRNWHETYASQGLVVIGNHFPEFSYERDLDNLRKAVVDLNVPYPVVQDNEGANWRAYNNHYWPTLYLIDKHGRLRYTHIGEGRYDETEAAIQALLAEPGPE